MTVNPNRNLELFASAPGSLLALTHGCICSTIDGSENWPQLGCPVHGLDRLAKVLDMVDVEDREVTTERK